MMKMIMNNNKEIASAEMTAEEMLAYEIDVKQNPENITTEGWNIVVKALLKQVPRKPKNIGNDWGVYCPTCSFNDGELHQMVGRKEHNEIEPMFMYCPNCGQKIDFSKS